MLIRLCRTSGILLISAAVLNGAERARPTPAAKGAAGQPASVDLSKSVEVDVSKAVIEVKGGGASEEKPPSPDAAKNTTEITADEAALDQKAHIGVFGGTVIVKNPQFTINCDKLTAFLRSNDAESKKTDSKHGSGDSTAPVVAPKAAVKPAPAAASETAQPGKLDPKDPKASPLRKAICEGNVVIVQDRLDAAGNVQHNIGRAKEAVYDSETGDIFLYGKPEVQDGENRCIALSEKTYMILNRNGHMFVHGPNKVIVEQATPNASTPAPAAASATPPAPATASRNAH